MRIDVRVKTGKSESKVIKKDFAEYEVWLKSHPVKGAANKELISVLANYFNVKKHDLMIVNGLISPQKIIELRE